MGFHWLLNIEVDFVRRAKRNFRNKIKELLGCNRLSDDFHIRAYCVQDQIVAKIWLRDRNWRLEGENWHVIALDFLLRIEYPRSMQGETQAFTDLDITSVVNKAARAGMLFSIEQYPKFRTTSSKPQRRNPACDKITDKLAEKLGVTEKLTDWHWSNQKTGPQTINKLHKLVDLKHEAEPTDDEDWFVDLMSMLHGQPHKNGKIIREEQMPIEDAPEELVVRDSSAGYDPPRSARGSNKRENASAALAEILRSICGEQMAPFVFAVLSKGNEFLKLLKDQRKIFGESTTQYMILQIVFGMVIYRKRNPYNGTAQNLSMGGNTGLQMVQKLTPELDWSKPGALKHAKEILAMADSLAESDKANWEYLVKFDSKQLVVAELLLMTNFEKYMYQPLEAAIASFLCPLVAVAGRKVIVAPNFMPSGSFFTLYINSELHRQQVTAFRNYVIKCNYSLPAIDVVRYGVRLTAPAMTVDPARLDTWYRSALVQGDDFLSRNMFGSYYDIWVDKVFGTITKGKFGNHRQVRFLQRFINWESELPMLVYDQERAAIKVCAPRTDMADLASAIKSIALSVGPHPWLPILKEAYEECNVDFGEQIEGSEGARNGDNIFNMEDMRRFWSPNHDVMRDTGTMRNLAKYGMHVETAERALVFPTTINPYH
jgi:hypothetical protein